MQARRAEFHHALEIACVIEHGGCDVPETSEGLIMQPQPPLRAEHRHGIVQLVERGLLHLNLSVVLRLEPKLAGDVAKQEYQTAKRVRLTHHAQGAAIE